MNCNEIVLTKVRYWGEHDGEHMFGIGEPKTENMNTRYAAARYLLYHDYCPKEGGWKIIGERFAPDGTRRNDENYLTQRFIDLLKLVAFPEIIE